jgi:hypothetical protein
LESKAQSRSSKSSDRISNTRKIVSHSQGKIQLRQSPDR